jgi:hypothetical protein
LQNPRSVRVIYNCSTKPAHFGKTFLASNPLLCGARIFKGPLDDLARQAAANVGQPVEGVAFPFVRVRRYAKTETSPE